MTDVSIIVFSKNGKRINWKETRKRILEMYRTQYDNGELSASEYIMSYDNVDNVIKRMKNAARRIRNA